MVRKTTNALAAGIAAVMTIGGFSGVARGEVYAYGRAWVDWSNVEFRVNGVLQPSMSFRNSFADASAEWNGAKDAPEPLSTYWPETTGVRRAAIGGASGHGSFSADAISASALVEGPSGSWFKGVGDGMAWRFFDRQSLKMNDVVTVSFNYLLSLDLITQEHGDRASGSSKIDFLQSYTAVDRVSLPMGGGVASVRDGESFHPDVRSGRYQFIYSIPADGSYDLSIRSYVWVSGESVPAPATVTLLPIAGYLFIARRRRPGDAESEQPTNRTR
jgi:hypothetical protein